ncbi:MAG: hypothetical protein ACKVT1_20095 [Dehalococcoidia bacterium]
MIFGFRGIRPFQILMALVALGCALGSTLLLKRFTDGGSVGYVIAAVVLGLLFLWLFGVALRAPTSFVAVAPERTRIRFAGFVDTVIDNRDIAGVRVVKQSFFMGLGVRTDFRGTVSLSSAWGEVAEITLNRPIRIWLVPRLVPLFGRRLRVSVRHPAKLVERFGEPPTQSSPSAARPRKMASAGRRRR